MPTPSDEYFVDQIFPRGELHIIGGPSGGGKTTWSTQFSMDWSAGKPIFGFESYPLPYAYVSLDRGERSLCRTLRRCGVDPATFPYIPGLRLNNPIDSLAKLLPLVNSTYPAVLNEAGLIIIEGISTLMPGTAKANDYHMAFKFFAQLSAWCNEYGVTLIGMMHSPKMKESERYLNPRQRLLHSVAIGGVVETIVLVEPNFETPTKRDRVITLLPRNASEQEFYVAFNEHGVLVPTEKPAAPAVEEAERELKAGELFDLFIITVPVGERFTTSEALGQLHKIAGVARSTVFSYITQAAADGRIASIGKRGEWCRLR